MTTWFDREHPPPRPATDIDTAELAAPIPSHNGYNLGYEPSGARLRPTLRARRLAVAPMLLAYAVASLGSLWLAFLAFLRLNPTVPVVLGAALGWFAPATVRLARWLLTTRRPAAPVRPPRLWLPQQIAATVVAGMYAYLLTDWLLHR